MLVAALDGEDRTNGREDGQSTFPVGEVCSHSSGSGCGDQNDESVKHPGGLGVRVLIGRVVGVDGHGFPLRFAITFAPRLVQPQISSATLKADVGNTYPGVVSKGLGLRQREVLRALVEISIHDTYSWDDLSEVFVRHPDQPDKVVEPWRWYTIDLLGLASAGTPRSDRVSLHRAVKGLAAAGLVEVSRSFPHADRLAHNRNASGRNAFDRFDLRELWRSDDRFPAYPDRCLWFRISVPRGRRTATEHFLDSIEDFTYDVDDFLEFPDRSLAWQSPLGRFITWLICGSPLNTIPRRPVHDLERVISQRHWPW